MAERCHYDGTKAPRLRVGVKCTVLCPRGAKGGGRCRGDLHRYLHLAWLTAARAGPPKNGGGVNERVSLTGAALGVRRCHG